jgi:Rieske Fe-S protein
MSTGVTRRSVLTGTATALIGGVAGFVVTRNSEAAKAKKGNTAANSYGGGGGGSGTELSPVTAIPDHGGVVVRKVVLTRNGADIRAFSAVCTHQGCLVDRVTARTIGCPCHGSEFDTVTGKVVTGPASSPLAPVAVTVREGKVFSA